MKLCVGATSRLVAEEAAKQRVAQIVASRRQVGEFEPGYTGYTSATLVETVAKLSGGNTEVVRDHGGPYRNGDPDDDWVKALDADVDAGFSGLHLDVCELSHDEQAPELAKLCRRYAGRVDIEIGGERDIQGRLYALLEAAEAECSPRVAVAQFGGHIWADRQCGALISADRASAIGTIYGSHQVVAKAHNFDWAGGRQDYSVGGYYNVAPEFGNVEVDAWLRLLPYEEGKLILTIAHGTGVWMRWFGMKEGTWLDRARCALRYHLEYPPIAEYLHRYDDGPVRGAIADAIARG